MGAGAGLKSNLGIRKAELDRGVGVGSPWARRERAELSWEGCKARVQVGVGEKRRGRGVEVGRL